jgi:hypothetical protein
VHPQEAMQSSWEFWTTEKLIDELVLCLGTVNTYAINEVTKQICITHKYYDRGEWYLYRVNVWQPPPIFVINISDLKQRVKSELKELSSTPECRDDIITKAIGRILESINQRYFHICGIAGKIRWRLDQ